MGTPTPKQFLVLGGQPLLAHSLRVLDSSSLVSEIILAVPEADQDYCQSEILSRYRFNKVTKVVPGGARRQDSVRLALEAAGEQAELVLVHDAVRPFLTAEMVERVIRRADEVGAAIVAIPMRDTVKEVEENGYVQRTMDRRKLWLAQTPQAFRGALLREVHRKALHEEVQATDDAQLVERYGHPVAIVKGSGDNIKITRPEDLAMGEAILAAREGR